MKPSYKIHINDKDYTERFQNRLISITITDEDGSESDELRIEIDDRDNLALPSTDAQIKIWIGYSEQIFMGRYTIQKITTTIQPRKICICARATDLALDMKVKRSYLYENIPLSDLLAKIAERYNLLVKCDCHETITVQQTEESDIHLLTRLAKERNATFGVKNGTIIFLKRINRPIIMVSREECISGSFNWDKRYNYKSVQAQWWDEKLSTLQQIQVGKGSPVFILQRRFASRDEAIQAATAKKAALESRSCEGSLTVFGRPDLFAGAELVLQGFKQEENGSYILRRVTHRLASSYITQLDFKIKAM